MKLPRIRWPWVSRKRYEAGMKAAIEMGREAIGLSHQWRNKAMRSKRECDELREKNSKLRTPK